MQDREGSYSPEQKFNPSHEWYFDDESVSELYQMIESKEIPKDETRKLLHEVQSEFQNLDSKTDKDPGDLERMGILNNIATQLFIYNSSRDNPKDEAPQEIGGVH